MCQTSVISDNIVRLSTRSFRQRLEAVAPEGYSVSRLVRLNRDLDNFYEFLLSQWQTVTEDDYKVFGKQLNIMLATLKELLTTYRRLSESSLLTNEIEKLELNYSAIKTINNDIANFLIPQDREMKRLTTCASVVYSQLNELSTLSDDWDGEGAEAVKLKAVDNCRKLLSTRNALVDLINDIYPTPTGNVCINWEKDGTMTSVEVGENRMAFYYTSADRSEVFDSPTFNFGDAACHKLYEYLTKMNC